MIIPGNRLAVNLIAKREGGRNIFTEEPSSPFLRR